MRSHIRFLSATMKFAMVSKAVEPLSLLCCAYLILDSLLALNDRLADRVALMLTVFQLLLLNSGIVTLLEHLHSIKTFDNTKELLCEPDSRSTVEQTVEAEEHSDIGSLEGER